MLDIRNDVKEFMDAGEQCDYGFGKQSDLYMRLITEELLHELVHAYDNNNLVEIADGIADSIWVIDGLINTIGEYDEIVNINRKYIIDELLFREHVINNYVKEKTFDYIMDILILDYGSLRWAYNQTKFDKEYSLNAEIIDILFDLVALGQKLNLPLQEIWDEVSRSNRSKISENGKVIKNEHGKIQKPETYSPPDIKSILQKHNLI